MKPPFPPGFYCLSFPIRFDFWLRPPTPPPIYKKRLFESFNNCVYLLCQSDDYFLEVYYYQTAIAIFADFAAVHPKECFYNLQHHSGIYAVGVSSDQVLAYKHCHDAGIPSNYRPFYDGLWNLVKIKHQNLWSVAAGYPDGSIPHSHSLSCRREFFSLIHYRRLLVLGSAEHGIFSEFHCRHESHRGLHRHYTRHGILGHL